MGPKNNFMKAKGHNCSDLISYISKKEALRVKKYVVSIIFRSLMIEASSSDGEDRTKPEQIPKGDASGETEKIISEQGGIEGQRKEVNVESYSNAASLGLLLKDLGFPASKDKIVKFAKEKGGDSEILAKLHSIQDRQYSNVSEIARASGMVY